MRHARARLWLAEGDFERAHAEACEAGALREQQGRPNPTWTPWRSTAALALAHLGRRDEAAALADAEVALAERFGAPVPIAHALHARAVAEADDGARVALCERGAGVVGGAPAVLAARARCASSSAARWPTWAGASRRARRCARRWPTPTPSAPCCWPSARAASSSRPGCARARRRSRAPRR